MFPCGAMANSMFNDTIFMYDGEFTETNLIEQVANPGLGYKSIGFSILILIGQYIDWYPCSRKR